MLQNNIIEPFNSDWYLAVVLVPKRNGEFRFAMDYRKLNKVTKPASFPLTRLEDVVDAIGKANAKISSVLDLAGGNSDGSFDKTQGCFYNTYWDI